MSILEMIAEWEKGCTCAGPIHDALFPESDKTSAVECAECTEALIAAIKAHELNKVTAEDEETRPC